MQADEKLNQDIAREYERVLHELDQELASFYARYAENESISFTGARRLLKDAELEDFRMSLDEFRAKAIAGGYDKELNEIYLRTRVSRLQALQTQIVGVLFQQFLLLFIGKHGVLSDQAEKLVGLRQGLWMEIHGVSRPL